MSAPAVVLFPVTGTDGVTHLVTEEAMAAGRPTGCYVATCGTAVPAASLTTPEHGRCRSCHRGEAGR